MNRADELVWLQNWYFDHCDGLWEHSSGVRINTLDNPGWGLSINLRGTSLESRGFERIKIDSAEKEWVHCWVEDKRFEARSGPRNLSEAIGIFRSWAEDA